MRSPPLSVLRARTDALISRYEYERDTKLADEMEAQGKTNAEIREVFAQRERQKELREEFLRAEREAAEQQEEE